MPEDELTPAAPWVTELRALVSAKLGYEVPPHRTIRELVPFALRQADAGGYPTTAAYVSALAAPSGGGDWDALVELVTIGETYFYRHGTQLEAVVAQLADTHASTGRAVRIWSAGCASGEEPYTLAMRLEEDEIAYDLLGSDVNEHVLQRARDAAPYSDRSVGHLPERLRERWLQGDGARRWRIPRAEKLSVSFRRHNLIEDAPLRHAAGAWDAILCRNVLLYFTPETGQRVVRDLSRTLGAGGSLWIAPCDQIRLGHGVSLSWDRVEGERLLRAEDPGTTPSVPPVAPPGAPPRPPPGTLRGEAPRSAGDGNGHLAALFAQGLVTTARQTLESSLRAKPDDGTAWVALAACHAAQHAFDEALTALGQAAATRPKPPGLEYLRGTIQLKTGRLREAQDALHAAVQDDPDDWASSYLLATLYRRSGRRLSEEAMLQRSADLLAADLPRAPEFGVGAGVVNGVHREPERIRHAVDDRLAELKTRST